MAKESFIFYGSFYNAIKFLNAEDRLPVYDAICKYSLEGQPIDFDSLPDSAKPLLILIEPQLKANKTRYENGAKGGAPLGNKNARKQVETTEKINRNQPTEKQLEQSKSTEKQPNKNKNVNKNVNVNENKNNNPKENTPKKPEPKPSPWRVRFDIFWKHYPRKEKKARCEKWFEGNNPSDELLEKMLKAIEVQKTFVQWQKEKGQFIPLPTSWLNDKRWEDESRDETKTEESSSEISDEEYEEFLKKFEKGE